MQIDVYKIIELCREYASIGFMCGLDTAKKPSLRMSAEDCWKQYEEAEAKIIELFKQTPSPATLNALDNDYFL